MGTEIRQTGHVSSQLGWIVMIIHQMTRKAAVSVNVVRYHAQGALVVSTPVLANFQETPSIPTAMDRRTVS